MTANPLTGKLGPVLLGIHIVALPLYPHMPLPVLLLTAVFTIWAWLILRGQLRQPGRFTMVPINMVMAPRR